MRGNKQMYPPFLCSVKWQTTPLEQEQTHLCVDLLLLSQQFEREMGISLGNEWPPGAHQLPITSQGMTHMRGVIHKSHDKAVPSPLNYWAPNNTTPASCPAAQLKQRGLSFLGISQGGWTLPNPNRGTEVRPAAWTGAALRFMLWSSKRLTLIIPINDHERT